MTIKKLSNSIVITLDNGTGMRLDSDQLNFLRESLYAGKAFYNCTENESCEYKIETFADRTVLTFAYKTGRTVEHDIPAGQYDKILKFITLDFDQLNRRRTA